jgi:predicted RND superfamily exporter protein
MHTTLGTSGVAILYNALVVIAGFMVLTQSTFLPNVALGWLVSFNMFVCFVCTVTMMAGAIHLLQPAFTKAKTAPSTWTTGGDEPALLGESGHDS